MSREIPAPAAAAAVLSEMSVRRPLSRPLSRVWSRQQHGTGWRVLPPELAARLETGIGQSVTARSELAESLSASWRVEPIGEGTPLKGGAGTAFAFALRSGEADAEVGLLRAALWHADRAGDVSTAMLFAPQCHPALPLSIAALPLIDAARATLHQHGAERVAAVAALPGLCEWVVETRGWEGEGLTEEQRGAVEAVARNEPRPGHSVLGVGTFGAAQAAFEPLALRFAERDHADAQCTAFRGAGASLMGVHWMHSSTLEDLRDSAGCTASFEFPPVTDLS